MGMTKEEAIKRLKEARNTIQPFLYVDEAIDYVIKALEQQPSEDCISRQAVDTLVDELARAISDERCCISRGRSTATIMQDILDLPPVTSQPTRWIPCSERLPEEFQRVLVTIVNYNGDKIVRVAEYHSWNGEFQIKENHEQWKVGEKGLLAWMPLPEPYKAESEDKE